jgi:hypothetical protein
MKSADKTHGLQISRRLTILSEVGPQRGLAREIDQLFQAVNFHLQIPAGTDLINKNPLTEQILVPIN